MSGGGVNASEGYWIAMLIVASWWTAISAILMIRAVYEDSLLRGWGWGLMFAASSLMAAYCFGKLVSGG